MAASDKQKISGKSVLGKETLWLVKTGDRVLGPFLTQEIIRRLRAKELVVIDEIISPQARWRHIRDEQLFASVVDEIRTGLMTVRDDTEVGEGTGGTPTIKSRSSGDDSTPIQQFNSNSTNASGAIHASNSTNAKFDSSFNVSRISDADIVSETDNVEHIHHASAREIERPKERKRGGATKKPSVHSSLSYAPPGLGKDGTVVSNTSRALWALVGIAIVVIGISFYVFKIAPIKRAGGRAEEVTRLRREADRAWSRAEFSRALKLYGQINREPHTDLETDLRQAILQLRIERETLAAKRRLEELIPKLATPESKIRARIALAVASLQSEEAVEAQNALTKLVHEPDSGPIAIFNLGAAQAATGQNAEATETLKKLESNPTLGAPSRLLRALIHLKAGNARLASQATNLEDQGEQPAFRQELYAIGAASDWIDGNKKRSNVRLRTALDTDPVQSEEFFYDPLVFLEAIRWKQMIPYIKDFSTRSKSNGAKALYALALIKADRRPEAQQYLSESLSPKVNDTDLQGVSAYGLMTQGRDDEARGALKFTKAAQGSAAPVITAVLEARLCERASDRTCADTVWADLAKRPHPPIAALVSTARVSSQIATEKVLDTVERLSVLYPHSVLVVKLHDDVFDSTTASKAQENSGKESAP